MGALVSAGTQFAVSGTVVFSASNTITFSSLSTASSYAVVPQITGAISNAIRSISAGTTHASGGEVVFASSNGIRFGMDAQTITAEFVNTSVWSNAERLAISNIVTNFNNTDPVVARNVVFAREVMIRPLLATRADLYISLSVNVTSRIDNMSYSVSFGVYPLRSGSTVSLASSAALTVTFNSGTSTSASQQYGGQSGMRDQSFALATWSFTPGEYLLAFAASGTGASTDNAPFLRVVGIQLPIVPNSQVSIASNSYFADGKYTTASSALPGTIRTSDIVPYAHANSDGLTVNAVIPYIELLGSF